MNILYLEDNLTLSQTIEDYLTQIDYTVHCVYNAQEALDAVYSENFDLFLLDVNIPKMNGFSLLKELRNANITTPAIFLTSLSSIDDITKAYDAGADDYLKKPFEFEELEMRIKALLKREFNTHNTLVQIDANIYFNTLSQELKVDKQTIFLNPKEILLLSLLLKNKNTTVNFETIFSNVWSSDKTHSELSLRTYVKNLRKHIGKDKIVSIKKVGYKLL